MINQTIPRRLRDQSRRATGLQKCRAFVGTSRSHDPAKDFGRDEVAFEAPQYRDVGQIYFLGGHAEAAEVDFYRHGYVQMLDPELFKLRELKDRARRLPIYGTPNATVSEFFYEIVERVSGTVVGEIITRKSRFPGSGEGNQWYVKRIMFKGNVVYELPKGGF